jgi:hypothetical protein
MVPGQEVLEGGGTKAFVQDTKDAVMTNTKRERQ